MGLLDGLSAGLTAGTKAATGVQAGQQQGSALLRAIQMQQLDANEKHAMIDMNTARAKSFMHSATQPPPATIHQLADGSIVSIDHLGHATPVTMNSAQGTAPSPATPSPSAGGNGPTGNVDLSKPDTPPQAPQQPVALKGRVPVSKVAPHTFMEDGKPIQGLVTEDGKFLRGDGTPATGKITPYLKPEKDPTDHFTFPTAVGPDGKPMVFRANTRTGEIAGTGVAAKGPAGGAGALAGPIAAKVGQFGEMLKKGGDLTDATDKLNVSLGNSASNDVANHGIGIGHMRIPGTQGLGSMMVNRTPEYATYQAALAPWILAAAHALSGARINADQVEQIRKSVEIQPGESAQSRAQKHKNMVDLTNSIGGSLPADAVASQEDQMDPAVLARLRGLGYRGASRGLQAPARQTQLRAPGVAPTAPQKPKGDFGVFGPSED